MPPKKDIYKTNSITNTLMRHNDHGNTNTKWKWTFSWPQGVSVSGRFVRSSLTLTAELDDIYQFPNTIERKYVTNSGSNPADLCVGVKAGVSV